MEILKDFLTQKCQVTRFTQEAPYLSNDQFLGQDSLNHMIAVLLQLILALFNSLNLEQKDFLDCIGKRFTVYPNLDIFDEPNDPTVALNVTDLKNYIVGIPDLYTKDNFEEVCTAREKEIEKKRTLTVPSV